MNRRHFSTLLAGAAAWPLAARAQQSSDRPLIGFMSPLSSATAARYIATFRSTLRELGYVEGGNIAIEFRFADGSAERMRDFAAELVALRPAVLVTGSPAAVLAVRDATRTIPIVMNSSQDPVRLGLAASMARPGGNVTGFWSSDEGLIGKQCELLTEAVPGTSRIGAILNPDDPADTESLKAFPAAARALGLTVRVIEVRRPGELEAAFTAAGRDGLQGLHISSAPLFNAHRTEVAALAARARLPAIYRFREFAVAGGLMSYAASLPDIYRRNAGLVDKILKGAKPADLPIERPTKFELVVNLKAAKAIDLKVPESFPLKADELIE